MQSIKIINECTTIVPNHHSVKLFACDEGTFAIYSQVNHFEAHVYWFSDNLLKNKKLLCTLDDPSPAISIRFIPEIDALVLSMESGNLYAVQLSGNYENVGTIDDGIEAMEWAPDNELFILITGYGAILEMNRNFDVVNEFPIYTGAFGEEEQINVGWGKKETQFHGSAGKQAAVVDTPAPVKLSPMDTMKSNISWRYDGKYFVVSTIDPLKNHRVLRIYNREAVLMSTSEPVNQLEGALCWRPAGNFIASSQLLPHRRDIVFFERNGLKHGEFTLESSTTQVHQLFWNIDSSILGILMTKKVNDLQEEKVIQLWTMTNYHYYMKQEIRARDQSDSITGFTWHDERTDLLVISYRSGLQKQFLLQNEISRSTSVDVNNPGTIVVIDGKKLLLTPFKHANTPPPMGRFTLNFTANVSSFCFGSLTADSAGDDVACWTTDNYLHIYKSRSIQKPIQSLLDVASVDMSGFVNEHGTPRQWTWVRPNQFVVITHIVEDYTNHDSQGKDKLHLIRFEDSPNWSSWSTEEIDVFEDNFGPIAYNLSSKQLVIEGMSGAVFSIDLSRNKLTCDLAYHLPNFCSSIHPYVIPTVEDECLFALDTKRNNLYVNEQVLLVGCTGFQVFEGFLIATTFKHTLRFFPVDTFACQLKLDEIQINSTSDAATANTVPKSSTSAIYDEMVRTVENGARIVLAVPGSVSLILQMPRGNLETIYPRALVLRQVRQLLDQQDYRQALVTCRKHRIDMNLLYDHNPQPFNDTEKGPLTWKLFINQIDDIDYLNLFLSGLRDEDVTISMYSRARATTSSTTAGGLTNTSSKANIVIDRKQALELAKVPGKLNLICRSLRTALEQTDSSLYVTCILTTFAKQNPPALDEALTLIRHIRSETSVEEAEKALKYVIFLANVDQLYNVALGMYDFGLVLMVAQHSQKDPREYLPFLTELQKLEKNRQRFRIDDYLKRHSKALKWLSCAGEEFVQECYDYIKKHKLYSIGLDIYNDDIEKRSRVASDYGDYLAAQGKDEDAGLIYQMAGESLSALECYIKAGLWREAFSIEGHGCSLNQIAESLKPVLVAKKQYEDAARMYIDYVQNDTVSIDLLLQGCLFQEAIRMATIFGRKEWIDGKIRQSTMEEYRSVMQDLKDTTETFLKQRKRLSTVRDEKMANLTQEGWDPLNANDMDIEMMSDTSSMATTRITARSTASRMSVLSIAKTARTSRGRRKLEKKKSSSREGGLFEEEFLMKSLRDHAIRLDQQYREHHKLILVLATYKELNSCKQLAIRYKEAMLMMKSHYKDIFIYPEHMDQWPDSLKELKAFVYENELEDDRLTISMLAPTIEAPILKSNHEFGFSFCQ